MKYTFFFIALLFTTSTLSQIKNRDKDKLGVLIGLNQFNIKTSDFETKPDIGWNIGFTHRGYFYNELDLIYSMQFSENNFKVVTNNLALQRENVNYHLKSAQLTLLLGYYLIDDYLSIEFGPMVQINGNLKIDNNVRNNNIRGTFLLAEDIIDINNINFYPTISLTLGYRKFQTTVQYQYGINNILSNLEKNLNGNPNIINGILIIYL